VLLNLRPDAVRVALDGAWTVALSTGMDREPGSHTVGMAELRANEGLVLRKA
jgi:hypothetical protein